MPSYRGIVLDSIHPNIKAALDIETAGFLRDNAESYNHISARTPWMRSVPFIRSTDPDNETVPRWQKYVLYSQQGTDLGPGLVSQFGRVGLDSNDTGLYRGDLRNTPIPGITSINVSNKGDLGTIRRATLAIKCYHEKDLEDLEMMYMVPGSSILLEWGWYSSNKSVLPIYLGDLQDGGKYSTIDTIQEQIIKKTLDVEDLLSEYNIDETSETSAGLYDGLLGVVTKFNWTNAADGSYDIQIDIIAPNSLALGIPTNTYRLGANIVEEGAQEVDGAPALTPINDVELIYYTINTKSARIESDTAKQAIQSNVRDAVVPVLNEYTDDPTVQQILASPNGKLVLDYSDQASSLGFIEFYVENDKLKGRVVSSDSGQVVQEVDYSSTVQGVSGAEKGVIISSKDGEQIFSNVSFYVNEFFYKTPQEYLSEIIQSAFTEQADQLTSKIDVEEDASIQIGDSIQFTLNGDRNLLTWSEVSFPLYNSKNNVPIMTCKPGIGTIISRENEKSFFNESYNEMGISVYGETYVSWRFIEEYIINELFMPRAENGKLATKFLSMFPQRKTQDTEEDAPAVYESVKIVNSKWIRSLDPTICIIPGQELTVVSDGETPEPLLGSEPLSSIENVFNVDDTFSEGYLRNILVNINVVRDASNNSTSVNDFALEVLSQVSEACGNPWSFKVITNTALQQVMVVDENYGGDYKGYKQSADQGDNSVYKFSGIGINNICRDVKIQTKLPNEVQALAYYAMSGGSSTTSQDINMFKLYGVGLEDRLKPVFTSENWITAQADREEVELANTWQRYQDLVKRTRLEVSIGVGETKGYREAINLAGKFVSAFIHDSSEKNPSYSPPIPIDISLTLNGISGIYMGNAIMLQTIDEGGMLPNRYRDIVALQATSVDQSISSDGWTTSIATLMRPIQTLAAPKVINRAAVEQAPPESVTTALTLIQLEKVQPVLDSMQQYLTHTGVPYINGSPSAPQKYYKIRGSQSSGLFTTQDDGEEYFPQKIFSSFIAMAQQASSAGVNLQVNDVWRSYEKQEYLYNGYKDYVNGVSTEVFYPADKPGESSHQSGDSIDISTRNSDHYKWMVNNAHKYGFRREVKGERWHWTYAPNQLIYGKIAQNDNSWDGEGAVL